VCTVARGLGAIAFRVERPGQLAGLAGALRDTPGPVVVEVCIDPEIKLPKRDRVSAMAPGDHRSR
jgi:acetolactate synthase-1/2/3 large subunit